MSPVTVLIFAYHFYLNLNRGISLSVSPLLGIMSSIKNRIMTKNLRPPSLKQLIALQIYRYLGGLLDTSWSPSSLRQVFRSMQTVAYLILVTLQFHNAIMTLECKRKKNVGEETKRFGNPACGLCSPSNIFILD